MRPFGTLLCCAALVGCTAQPTVQYRVVKNNADMVGMSDAFFLQRSKIVVKVTETVTTDKGGGDSTVSTTLAVSSAPQEDAMKIGVRPIRNWLGTTTFGVNKQDNTDLVSSVGVEVSNDVVKNIAEVGSVITKLVGLAALAGAGEGGATACVDSAKSPLEFLADDSALMQGRQSVDGNAAKATKGCITVRYGPLPPDAIEAKDLPLNTDTHLFYYAACRSARITVAHRDDTLTGTVRVSDPRFLQAVELPPKGSVTLHSQCGASVKSEKAENTASASSIVDALSAQGKAIKEAIDAAKK